MQVAFLLLRHFVEAIMGFVTHDLSTEVDAQGVAEGCCITGSSVLQFCMFCFDKHLISDKLRHVSS